MKKVTVNRMPDGTTEVAIESSAPPEMEGNVASWHLKGKTYVSINCEGSSWISNVAADGKLEKYVPQVLDAEVLVLKNADRITEHQRAALVTWAKGLGLKILTTRRLEVNQ